MFANPGAICTAHSLSIRFGISSGPEAFDGFMSFRSFASPALLTVMFDMLFLMNLFVVGRMVVFTVVKTDWNCLTRISALSFASLNNLPWSFSGATPMESCFLDLMYFQNGFELLFCRPSIIFLLMYCHSALLIFFLHSFW